MIDWKNISCICGEKRKNTRNNKVHFDPLLSNKQKGVMVFYCTNNNSKFHPKGTHLCIRIFEVDDEIVSVNVYVMKGKLPQL